MQIQSYIPNNYLPAIATGALADTVRQQILDAAAARLATIAVANGYRTDIGSHVEEWDTTPMDQTVETLILDYKDLEEDRLDVTVGQQDMSLALAIRIRTSGSTSLADMRDMVADVVKCLADPDNDITLGGLANDTNVDGPATLVKGQKKDTVANAEVRFKIEYSVNRGES